MGKCLGPEGASFTEERGSRELGCYLQLFLGPKKDPAWRISEGAHLVQENSAGGPSGARATPSTHGGGRRRSPLTPGPSGGPRARKALSGRVQPASGASEVWTPRGVCARERASSNRSGQVEATKIKSDLPAWRSTPPPPWFDPRPGRSEPRRVQPRLLAVARYCRGKGVIPTPLPPVATTWEPSSQGGARVTGEYGGGSVAACKVSAGPSRRPGEEDRKVGMRRPPSQQWGANLEAEQGEREENEGGEPGDARAHPQRRPERVAARGWPPERKTETLEQRTRRNSGWEAHRKRQKGTRTRPRRKSKLHKEQSLGGTQWGGGEAAAGARVPVACTEVGGEDVAGVTLPFASPTSGGSGAAVRAGRAELGFRSAWREGEPQIRSHLQHATRQRGLGAFGACGLGRADRKCICEAPCAQGAGRSARGEQGQSRRRLAGAGCFRPHPPGRRWERKEAGRHCRLWREGVL